MTVQGLHRALGILLNKSIKIFCLLVIAQGLISRASWSKQASEGPDKSAQPASAAGKREAATLECTEFLRQIGISKGETDSGSGLSEYRLNSNGLTILLCERHSAPVVVTTLIYKVGSRFEQPGYTGATHFLEHMMFKGTRKFDPLKGQGLDHILKPVGGMNNASTYYDRTSYFELVPNNMLGLCLQFEADRMRNLLLRETDRSSEMTVVRNEFERAENNPQVVLESQLFAHAFLVHPYRHPVIGSRTDIEKVPTGRLRRFYKDFYYPNNAILLVIGDLEPGKTLSLIARAFSGIARSAQPIPPMQKQEPAQQSERRFVVQKGEDLPEAMIGFHIPAAVDADTYALAVIESLLGDSTRQSSRLYKALVDSGLASETYANAYQLKDPGLFVVAATATHGSTPQALEKAMLAQLDKLRSEEVPEGELSRAKMSVWKALKLVASDPLAMSEQIADDASVASWQWWATYEDKIKAVTADDIKRAANRYFTSNNRTVGYYLPSRPAPLTAIGSEDSPVPKPLASLNQSSAPAQPALVDDDPLAQSLPRYRGGGPVDAPAPKSFSQRVQKRVLANGLTVLVTPVPDVGTAAIFGTVQAGEYFALPDKKLVPALLANVLPKGSARFDKETLGQELENMGTALEFDAGNFWIKFSSRAVSEDLARLLTLLSDTLRNPALRPEELETSKKIFDSTIRQDMLDTKEVAENALKWSLYKPDSVYYEKPFPAQLKELSQTTLPDLRKFHERTFSGANVVLAIVGDVEPAPLFALVERLFGSWSRGRAGIVKTAAVIPKGQARRVIVPVADKENVDVCIGRPVSVSMTASDYLPAILGNAALGYDSFVSRLSPVRQKYGLTYDISSAFLDKYYKGGPWAIEFSVNPKSYKQAIAVVEDIAGQYQRTGITAKEVSEEAGRLSGEFLVSLRTPQAIAQSLATLTTLGLGPEFMDRLTPGLKAVTRAQANKAIRSYLSIDHAVTTVAGSVAAAKTRR